jgi:ribonucleoside-diphosphate reductase alpha chain
VFSFPQKAPEQSATRDGISATEFLEKWKTYQEHWCEHKPSVTISVAEDEWMGVAAWSYDNFDILSGVSYLPFDPTEYPQAPYQTLTKEEYKEWTQKMPAQINWDELRKYEDSDHTTGSQEYACVAGLCEI